MSKFSDAILLPCKELAYVLQSHNANVLSRDKQHDFTPSHAWGSKPALENLEVFGGAFCVQAHPGAITVLAFVALTTLNLPVFMETKRIRRHPQIDEDGPRAQVPNQGWNHKSGITNTA